MRNMNADTMSVSLEEGLKRYDSAEAEALRRFEENGLHLLENPPRMKNGEYYNGRVPVNLSSERPEVIGDYYGLQMEFTDYVAGLQVVARAEMISAKEKLDLTQAAVRKTKAGTVQDKGDLAVLDSRYVDSNSAYMEAKEYYELVSAVVEAASRDLKFVSRIIETKKMEMDAGWRANSIGRIPANERPGADRFRRSEGRRRGRP